MTKIRNTMMNSKTNGTDKAMGTKKGRKQRLTTANNQSYLTQLYIMAADIYLQNRMQRYSAVTDASKSKYSHYN